MYAYVFDSLVQDKKYRTESIRVETRLATLGIQGRQEKITILKNIQETVRDLIKRGAETIVAVGNDQTVIKVLPLLMEHDITLGIIPIGPDQAIAKYLGIPDGPAACDVLSRRVIRKLDIGKANTHYFLLQASLPHHALILCDGQYTVSALDSESQMWLTNLSQSTDRSSPEDGRLELMVQGPASRSGWSMFRKSASDVSVFPVRTAKVQSHHDQSPVILDGHTQVKAPVTIEVVARKLAVIVGRDRHFA